MPALTFGLKPATSRPQHSSVTAKPHRPISSVPLKRKNLFDQDDAEEDDQGNENGGLESLSSKVRNSGGLPSLREPGKKIPVQVVTSSNKNLSALHSARLQDRKVVHPESVYDYDGVYDTFHARPPSSSSMSEKGTGGPKYMTSLVKSAEVRKRDQLRAEEKRLAREREKEGDEFLGKEAFVTGAYKLLKEEGVRVEEEERKREEQEQRERKEGRGMVGWYSGVLEREEVRRRGIEERVRNLEKEKKDGGWGGGGGEDLVGDGEGREDEKKAKDLNQWGARIAVNDEGEVVDKRQLLAAGLNVANRPTSTAAKPGSMLSNKCSGVGGRLRSGEGDLDSSRQSQRARQTAMMERQLEEMAARAEEGEQIQKQKQERDAASRKTAEEKMGVRERFLARKREREEEEERKKRGG